MFLLLFLVYGLDARGSVYILEGVVRAILLREWPCIYEYVYSMYVYIFGHV